jgi:hypothetical protein
METEMSAIETEKIEKSWCIMCGAAPGNPCTVISTVEPDSEYVKEGHGPPQTAGEPRSRPHFYRGGLDHKPAVTVANEPPFAKEKS